jgi:hypothetical protein
VITVIAGDELLEPRALNRAEHGRHVVELPGQRQRRGRDVHARMLAAAAPRAGMRQQHYAQYRRGSAAGAQELLEQVGWLVQLDARGPAAAVADAAMCDEIAEPVELLEAPGVSIGVDGRVEVLALDRHHTWRPDQQVVDLATPVAVAAQQNPVIAECMAEFRDDLLLAGHSGGEPFFKVIPSLRLAWPGRQHRSRRRGEPLQFDDRERGA